TAAAIATQSYAPPVTGGGGQTVRPVASQPQAEMQAQPAPAPAVEAGPAVRLNSLSDLAKLADWHGDVARKGLLRRCLRPVSIEPGRLEVSLTPDAPRDFVPNLSNRLKEWTGRPWMVTVSREEGGATLAEIDDERRETAMMDARNDPAVAAILARFPGAKIVNVTIPNAADVEDDAPADLMPDPGIDDDDDDF